MSIDRRRRARRDRAASRERHARRPVAPIRTSREWRAWCFTCEGVVLAAWDADLEQEDLVTLWRCPRCSRLVEDIRRYPP